MHDGTDQFVETCKCDVSRVLLRSLHSLLVVQKIPEIPVPFAKSVCEVGHAKRANGSETRSYGRGMYYYLTDEIH